MRGSATLRVRHTPPDVVALTTRARDLVAMLREAAPDGARDSRLASDALAAIPTTRCNLACRLCYTKQSHGKLDLDPDDLRDALVKLRRSPAIEVKTIHLNWLGEPLMNPRFHELLAVTRDVMPDVPLQWHTNGTMMTRKRARQVLDLRHPHTIFVSIDGGNARLHDLNRGEGSFVRTLRGLETLLDEAAGDPVTRVGIYQIDLGEPVENYDPDFRRLIGRVHSHVKVTPLLPGGAHHAVDDTDDLESDERLHERMMQDVNPRLPVPDGACFWAGHVINVSICIISHGQAGIIGNLFTDSAETVLAQGLAFRDDLETAGRCHVGHCRTCRKPEGDVYARYGKRRPTRPPMPDGPAQPRMRTEMERMA